MIIMATKTTKINEKLKPEKIKEYNNEISNIKSGNLEGYDTLNLDELDTKIRKIEDELGL